MKTLEVVKQTSWFSLIKRWKNEEVNKLLHRISHYSKPSKINLKRIIAVFIISPFRPKNICLNSIHRVLILGCTLCWGGGFPESILKWRINNSVKTLGSKSQDDPCSCAKEGGRHRWWDPQDDPQMLMLHQWHILHKHKWYHKVYVIL